MWGRVGRTFTVAVSFEWRMLLLAFVLFIINFITGMLSSYSLLLFWVTEEDTTITFKTHQTLFFSEPFIAVCRVEPFLSVFAARFILSV